MSQNCGNCVYLNKKDYKQCGDWFHGHYDAYYCTDLRKYKMPNEGASCKYYQPLPEKESGGCFITTIVVAMCGFSDNSRALNILRRFRENILQSDEDGINLLKTYDVIGPEIAKKLSEETNNKELAYKLYNESIMPTSMAVENYKYSEAIDIYKKMIRKLMLMYQININTSDYEYDEDVKTSDMGHGTARVHKISVKSE